jgi:hypothetical protein
MSGVCVCGVAAGEGWAGTAGGLVVDAGWLLMGECTCGAFASVLFLGACLFAGPLRFRVGARLLVVRLALARGLGLLTPGMACPSC